MQRKVVWYLTAITILLATTANAQEPFNSFWKNRQSRQREAQKWRDGFKKLDAQIPTMSPAEENWIKTEIDDEVSRTGTYTKRALDAMQSKEYDIHIAKPHLVYIILQLTQLSEMTSNFPKEDQEVKLWARLAWLLMDYNFWQAIDNLVKRGIVEKQINGYDNLYYQDHIVWASYILNEIVISHLDGKLSK